MSLEEIRRLVRRRQYRFSFHAEQQREADHITLDEFEQTITSPEAELIEGYLNDPRGPSYLILGFTRNKHPIHVVCGGHEGLLIIITIYRPNPQEWVDRRKRR